MKFIIKAFYVLLTSMLMVGCLKDEPTGEWGGPDPPAYDYQTIWLATEKRNGDGEWESLELKDDTLVLGFDYKDASNNILSANGSYFIYGDDDGLLDENIAWLKDSIPRFGLFNSSDSVITLRSSRLSTDDRLDSVNFSITSEQSEEGTFADILIFTNNNVSPAISLKYRNIEFKETRWW